MNSDPFDEIQIERGTIVVSHSGGTSWKWTKTEKYKFQLGEFFLIEYSRHYGKLCEYWEKIDFNLTTGKLTYVRDYEKCESQEQITWKSDSEWFYVDDILITMGQRNHQEICITTPKYGYDIYISYGDN